MTRNFLFLNIDKTEMLVLGPKKKRSPLEEILVNLDNGPIKRFVAVRNLGVTFNADLSFDDHINNVTRISYFHLRNISRIRPFLSMPDAETLVHAFVTSRLDYCNVLFSGLSSAALKKLQLVQNTAARILTRTRKFDHITPVLASLHWLPINARADFKVLLLTYKILHGLAPLYLEDLVTPYIPPRALRSQQTNLLVIPRTKTKSWGNRAFSYRAPLLWNKLPTAVKEADSVEMFKSRIKTHLFSLHFE